MCRMVCLSEQPPTRSPRGRSKTSTEQHCEGKNLSGLNKTAPISSSEASPTRFLRLWCRCGSRRRKSWATSGKECLRSLRRIYGTADGMAKPVRKLVQSMGHLINHTSVGALAGCRRRAFFQCVIRRPNPRSYQRFFCVES